MMLHTGVVVCAYEFPNALWSVNDAYSAALEAQDHQGVIEFGTQILNIMKNEPENSQVLELIGSRLEQVALAYERLGDFANAADYNRQYAGYAGKLGWADAEKIAWAKVAQYTPQIDLYTASEGTSTGARLEPSSGVYYGATSDGGIRDYLQDESMILLYLEFGDTNLDWTTRILSEAQEKGIAVEFAWNLPGEGGQIASVMEQSDYIISVLRVLGEYKTPIFLRFGAEVNIWNDKADAAQYIEAFRHVAGLARQYAPDVAMVWSVNEVSSWDIRMEDYYPGDEYVDWVGVSLYAKKYFLGVKDRPENEKFNEVVFLSGDNADPVTALGEVIEKFGGTKPVMVAESGASHYIRTVNEDATDWAMNRMRQLYLNVPMVYPQVKLIAHFDKVIESEINDYALSDNARMAALYQQLVKQPQFIQGSGRVAASYRQLGPNVPSELTISAYAHVYRQDTLKVNYYIDDTWVSSADEMPYTRTLDFSAFGAGSHTVTVTAESGGAVAISKSYTVQVEADISILLDGKKIETDVAPVLQENRTLVPVRVITEALGANVSWEESTQTVTIVRGDVTLTLRIDQPAMTKNGIAVTLDAPPRLLQSRTMVPIRAISEAFHLSVGWDEATRTVVLTS